MKILNYPNLCFLVLFSFLQASCRKTYTCSCEVTSTVTERRGFVSSRTYTQSTSYHDASKWTAQSECNSKTEVVDNAGVVVTDEYDCTLSAGGK